MKRVIQTIVKIIIEPWTGWYLDAWIEKDKETAMEKHQCSGEAF